MVAGVAMASAGVIAVSPVAPPMPTVQDVQERVTQAAVQLTAATNPLIAWQQTIANTFASLDTLIDGSSLATDNLVGALSTGYIFQEVANVLIQNTLNPGPLLDEIINFNSNFGPVIDTAITDTIDRLTLAAQQFPEVLTNTLTYLSQGQFVESFSEINGWFVLRVLGGVRPLIPILDIPGNFAAALPGVEKLDDLLKVVSEFALTKAIFEPVLGGILQSAELLDAARAAFGEGDYVDAVSNLANIPVLGFNALVNGMTPAGTTSEWQGLLDRGLVSYLAVTFTNLIANAIKPPVPVDTLAFRANDTLEPQAPTDYSFGGKTYTFENSAVGLDNSGAGDGAGAGDGSGSGAGTGDGAGAGDGTGSGAGAGDGTGSGAGDGTGVGAVDDSDDGEDAGSGDGEGAGSGDGEGAGNDDGDNGSGSGAGAGSASGAGAGSASGAGAGSASGAGAGSGSGSGSGSRVSFARKA
ncbi:hypothetical protein, partial [Mycolicibacterium gadium]|uniref:hypothetical protein n=1 Tax=Mycolicibacterium gadium TaxID=1794 RepID=UPI0021F288FE